VLTRDPFNVATKQHTNLNMPTNTTVQVYNITAPYSPPIRGTRRNYQYHPLCASGRPKPLSITFTGNSLKRSDPRLTVNINRKTLLEGDWNRKLHSGRRPDTPKGLLGLLSDSHFCYALLKCGAWKYKSFGKD
jgi:hypothetical protein